MAKEKRKLPLKMTQGKAERPEKIEAFCLEYIKDENGTRAAIAVGYAKKSASVMACGLLAKHKVQARLKELRAERNARVLLEGDEILLGIKHLAVSDVRRLFDVNTGCVLPMKDWPDDIAVCVSSIEVDEIFAGKHPNRVLVGYTKKIKLWDKPKSQENLGRNKGLFKDIHEVEDKTPVQANPELLQDAFKKSQEKV